MAKRKKFQTDRKVKQNMSFIVRAEKISNYINSFKSRYCIDMFSETAVQAGDGVLAGECVKKRFD